MEKRGGAALILFLDIHGNKYASMLVMPTAFAAV